MTHLRRIMLEELQRRHYSEATTQRYIRFIERFAQHFHRSPDRLGPQHIREYQAQLFTVHKLAPGSVTNHLCALRFFYIQTLKRPWSIADTPYPKKRHRLPKILSQEEVAQLIDAAPTPFYRTILMTLYGTGVRRTELTRLKVSDIDSRRMVVHIQDGKGGQDIFFLSPPRLQFGHRLVFARCADSSSTVLTICPDTRLLERQYQGQHMGGICGQPDLLRRNRSLIGFLEARSCLFWVVLAAQQATALDQNSHPRSHRFSGKSRRTIQSTTGFVQVSL